MQLKKIIFLAVLSTIVLHNYSMEQLELKPIKRPHHPALEDKFYKKHAKKLFDMIGNYNPKPKDYTAIRKRLLQRIERCTSKDPSTKAEELRLLDKNYFKLFTQNLKNDVSVQFLYLFIVTANDICASAICKNLNVYCGETTDFEKQNKLKRVTTGKWVGMLQDVYQRSDLQHATLIETYKFAQIMLDELKTKEKNEDD